MSNLDEQTKAYETVASAIRFVRAHADTQPALEDVAAHVGLSPFHLQRVFAAWAGISPKRFLQVLTLERAKHALQRQGKDVLEAALAAGLSGPSRLHDLMVACEAVTPGELKSGGAGIDIVWGVADSPFGRATVGSTQRGVCHLHFSGAVGSNERDDAALRTTWPAARLSRDDARAADVLAQVFNRERKTTLHVLLKGTNFQVQVWRALLNIPPGDATSYGALAARVGRPGSARAVGQAVGRNDVAVLIPCHRVLREDGALGGYRWGTDCKAAVLAWEAAQLS